MGEVKINAGNLIIKCKTAKVIYIQEEEFHSMTSIHCDDGDFSYQSAVDIVSGRGDSIIYDHSEKTIELSGKATARGRYTICTHAPIKFSIKEEEFIRCGQMRM